MISPTLHADYRITFAKVGSGFTVMSPTGMSISLSSVFSLDQGEEMIGAVDEAGELRALRDCEWDRLTLHEQAAVVITRFHDIAEELRTEHPTTP